jgi:hypothetical protein
MSSLSPLEVQPSQIAVHLSALLGKNVASVERIGSGRNSRVFLVRCDGSSRYAAKFYPGDDRGGRDRLAAEYSAFEFLAANGVGEVPNPVAIDRARNCAVYEFVEGEPIPSQDVSESDIDDAVRFLLKLKDLSLIVGESQLSAAAEACFSTQAIIASVQRRLQRLDTPSPGQSQASDLQQFLHDEYMPRLEETVSWCKSRLESLGLPLDGELTRPERTLSPSDFGFHNALRRADSRIVFVDFEYFGWDDPAKMICDFLLHPGMDIQDDLKKRFVKGLVNGFQGQTPLATRVEILYSLFALKWCLILLNEFIPERMQVRVQASSRPLDENELKSSQLEKAKLMLQKAVDYRENFPYRI